MIKTPILDLLNNPKALQQRIELRLNPAGVGQNSAEQDNAGAFKGSAVLFLLTLYTANQDVGLEPCLLLNKRSQRVLQPGDLCCPGGGYERSDHLISKLLRWPLSPLSRWRSWTLIKHHCPAQARHIALLLATGLREAWEEMRLNPFKVKFLGPLAVQRLIMFDRIIHPLVGWIPRAQQLSPNWEVERIIHIPLRRLLNHRNYGRYRLNMAQLESAVRHKDDFPCFIHQGRHGNELLWGATFRITMDFLNRIFNFALPSLADAPVYHGLLDHTYLNGSLLSNNPGYTPMHKEDY